MDPIFTRRLSVLSLAALLALTGCPFVPVDNGNGNGGGGGNSNRNANDNGSGNSNSNRNTNSVDPDDTDDDGLPNERETELGTDADDPDTDADGLSDGEEVNDSQTDPLDPDTDDDDIADGRERDLGFSPSLRKPIGTVDLVLCNSFLVMEQVQPTTTSLAFDSTATTGNFSDWNENDDIVFDERSDELVNVDRNERLRAELVGDFIALRRLTDQNFTSLTVTLDDGSIWLFQTADSNEVRQWIRSGDDIAVIGADARNEDGILINTRRCLSIEATRQN